MCKATANQDLEHVSCSESLPSPDEQLDKLAQQVLCSDRVTQMTKAYNDIEAVTRLLEEKERDLELAARIGQTLLEKNKELAEQNEILEDQVSEVNEKVSQLKHELSMKDALLQVYVNEYTDTESPSTPNDLRLSNGLVNWDSVQKKINVLEEENFSLKVESAQLKNETLDYEEKEQTLVNDACKHLAEINDQIRSLHDELGNKAEVNIRQQEEISAYMGRCLALETRAKKQTIENAELQSHLVAAQDAQRQLTTELSEMSDKYHECLGLLHEAQEELKGLQKKERPSASRPHYSSYTPFLPEGSLAAELENTLKRDMAYPGGYSPADRRKHNKRIMETAKYIKRHASSRKTSGSMLSIPGSRDLSTSGNESCESILGSSSNRSSLYISDSEGLSDNFDSMYGSDLDLGRPGIPGSNDLETALKRLSMRKANEINEQIINEHHERALVSDDEHRRDDRETTPVDLRSECRSDYRSGCRSPDSIMSTGSASALSDLSRLSGYSGFAFRFPEKLQIVKPMEGSATLHHWQRLATPHLGGFLDDRHGVHFRGQRQLPPEDDLYELSDFEEDDYDMPGVRQTLDVAPTFTYTTAKVLHPSDEYNLTNIYQGRAPQLSVDTTTTSSKPPQPANHKGAHTSTTSSCAPTPTPGMQHRASTTTYSMSMGLARILRERGLSAACVSKKRSGVISRYDAANPTRFRSIVTETMAEGSMSKTEVIYSTPSCPATPIDSLFQQGTHPTSHLTSSAALAQSSAGQTVLNLVDRIRNIGLGSVIGAVSPSSGASSGTATPSSGSRGSLCSIEEEEHPSGGFCGLNSIMTMNNKRGFLTRGQAAQGVVPGGRKAARPSGYFCTEMVPPSRPTTLALSRVISMPSPVKVTTATTTTTAGNLPKTGTSSSGAVPKNTAKDNHNYSQQHFSGMSAPQQYGGMSASQQYGGMSASQQYGGMSASQQYGGMSASQQYGGISSSSSGGMVMSSSTSGSVSSSVVRGKTSDSGCLATTGSVSDSLLKHLGSAHMRSAPTSGAALRQQEKKSKSGGQLL